MDLPAGTLERYSTPKQGAPRNEREEMLSKFLERLNGPREAAGYKKLTVGRLAKLFEAVPTSDLYPFFKRCEDARNFGSMFWYCMKPNQKEI